MAEQDTPVNQNISQEGLRDEQNQESELAQNNTQQEFLTQDQTNQIDDNNNQNQPKKENNQTGTETHQLEAILQNGFNSLNPIETSNSTSASSTKPSSPKQKKSPNPQDKDKSNQQSKSQSNDQSCNCTEEDLDEYIIDIVDNRTPPPKELRNPILQLLNRRRVQALVDGDYDYAEEQENNIKAFNRVIQSQDNKSNENEQFEILFGRYQQLQKDYQDITEDWDSKINKYNEEQDEKYKQLLQKQEEEKEDHQRRWADPVFLRPFTKASPKLNSMREQERAMAVARMYQQAKVMKQSADRLQKEETAAANQRIAKSKEIEWNRMIERHEVEKKKFNDHTKRNVAFLESEKQKELKPTLNALNQIKSKKGLLLSTKQSSATITKTAQDIEAQTPRTHKKFTDFKSEKKKPKLAVQPVKNQPMQSTKRSSKTKSKLQKNHSQKQTEEQQQSQSESENLQQTENQENSNENNQVEDSNKNDQAENSNENGQNENAVENDQNKGTAVDDQSKDSIENDNITESKKIENDDKDKSEAADPPGILEKMSDAANNLDKQEEENQLETKNDDNENVDKNGNSDISPQSPK